MLSMLKNCFQRKIYIETNEENMTEVLQKLMDFTKKHNTYATIECVYDSKGKSKYTLYIPETGFFACKALKNASEVLDIQNALRSRKKIDA